MHYPLACHQHPHVRERFGTPAALPRTEQHLAGILTLPLHPYLDEHAVDRVCQALTPLIPAARSGREIS